MIFLQETLFIAIKCSGICKGLGHLQNVGVHTEIHRFTPLLVLSPQLQCTILNEEQNSLQEWLFKLDPVYPENCFSQFSHHDYLVGSMRTVVSESFQIEFED